MLWRPFFVFFLCWVWGCATPEPPASEPEAAASAPAEEAPAAEWALAIHGGAGVMRASLTADVEPAYLESLRLALAEGRERLARGDAALDVVEAVVRRLEDDPLFNAGRGSVFTSEGTNEMDAAIMDGRTLACGAVTGVKTVRHPITLARRVMEESPHVFFAGAGAEAFAEEVGVERADPEFFRVQRRYDQWQRALERERSDAADEAGNDRSTVGAVARDQHGDLAAATSTGGMTNKRWGRIGDVPVIGAGTYASNASAAVSCTGHGERFIERTVARDVAARIEYGGQTLAEAARAMIHEVLEPGDGGLIAVGADGALAIEFNSEGMFHGAADSTGRFEVGIWP